MLLFCKYLLTIIITRVNYYVILPCLSIATGTPLPCQVKLEKQYVKIRKGSPTAIAVKRGTAQSAAG